MTCATVDEQSDNDSHMTLVTLNIQYQHTYTYICTYVHTYTYITHMHTQILYVQYTHTYIHTHDSVHTYVHTYKFVSILICTYIRTYCTGISYLFPDVLIGGDHLLHEVPGDAVKGPLLHHLHSLAALLQWSVAELQDTLH